MKIHPVEGEFFHSDGCTDGQSEMTNLIVAFHRFADVPKIISVLMQKKCSLVVIKLN
jgi:hypothetical protein